MMADMPLHAVQNDLFYAVGGLLLASHPYLASYWQPVIRPASPPEQYQASSVGAVTTVTQTATLFPKPTTLTTTSTVAHTTTDFVTELITNCASTLHRTRYKIKWSHYSPDPSCPSPYTVYNTGPTYVPETPCETAVGPPAPATASWIPWSWTNWAELGLFSLLLLTFFLRYIHNYNSDYEDIMSDYKKSKSDHENSETEHKKQIRHLVEVSNNTKNELLHKLDETLRQLEDERDMKDESNSALVKLRIINARGDK